MKETAIWKQHIESKYPVICDKPNQSRQFNFPKRHFGASKIVSRSFHCQWLNKWKWIHYDEAQDLAFCHVCCHLDFCHVNMATYVLAIMHCLSSENTM